MDPLGDADGLCRYGTAELTARYANGTLSPVEVTRACLARAEVVQARLNAFALIDHDGALAAARRSEARWLAGSPLGAIDGVPATIKDIVQVAGWPVSYGSRAVPPVRAAEDAPATRLLRQAGAVLLGLTTVPEFGWKAVTDSPGGGITRNPYDPALTPGGSSGGAAVAAACGAGVLHLGTDGGGSIRIPAAFCGVAGLKPTFGRVPAHPLSSFGTIAHLGPIARDPTDLALMLDVLSGRDSRDWFQSPLPFPAAGAKPLDIRGLRIGAWSRPPDGTPEVRPARAFQTALARLEAAGAIVRPVALPAGDIAGLFRLLWSVGAAQRLRTVPPERLPLVDPGLVAMAEAGARVSLPDYLDATSRRAAFGAAIDALFEEHDVLASPAAAVMPFAAGAEVPPDSGLRSWIDWAGFSYPVNLAQAPACVVPCADGAPGPPPGIQFVAPRGQDARALAAAAAFLGLR